MIRLAAVAATTLLISAVCAVGGGGAAWGAPGKQSGGRLVGTSTAPARGGTLKVLEGSGSYTWHGLDPALDAGFRAYPFYMDAIYGDLFEQGKNNQPIPDLATGYQVSSDARTATITLRRGVTFSDGTPFNASAVKWNMERDLAPSSGDACACTQDFPISSIDTPNAYEVVLHLKYPYSPIIISLFSTALNWIASPTAVQKEGAKQFAVTPVGAGPFLVKADELGAALQLVRNPNYWAKGKPYLDSLTFSLIGSDETAYEALQAGQAQAYQNLGTIPLANQAKKLFSVTPSPASTPWGVQLNTSKAPFNNLKAREALYYATNAGAIDKSILLGQGDVSQSPTGPQGSFYEPTVPGYRTYDLAKAKSLVRELGGLHFTLMDVQTPLGNLIDTALKAEWSEAGIEATLEPETLGVYIKLGHSNQWQADIASVGNFDPGTGFGLSFRFASTGPFTGAHDPALDHLITEGDATTNRSKRAKIYHQAFKIISDQAYCVMLFTEPAYNIAARAVTAPGLTTVAPEVFWEDATVRK